MRYLELSELEPGMEIAKDIIGDNSSLILRRGVTLNSKYIDQLRSKGCTGAYINEPEGPKDVDYYRLPGTDDDTAIENDIFRDEEEKMPEFPLQFGDPFPSPASATSERNIGKKKLSRGEVVLSTGEHAAIVRHTYDPERPIVKLLDSKLYINLTQDEYKDIHIVSEDADESKPVTDLDRLTGITNMSRNRRNAPRIMVVDDSIINLQQASQALAEEGYEIIALQSGVAALNYIKDRGAPDLVVMDIMMPNVSGISAVSTMRRLGFIDLPVIFLTAKGDRETIMKCASVQAKDYIIKPVRPEYLRDRVAKALIDI